MKNLSWSNLRPADNIFYSKKLLNKFYEKLFTEFNDEKKIIKIYEQIFFCFF